MRMSLEASSKLCASASLRTHWSSGMVAKAAVSGQLLLWALQPRAPAAVLGIAGPPVVGRAARALGPDVRARRWMMAGLRSGSDTVRPVRYPCWCVRDPKLGLDKLVLEVS